MRNQHSEVCIGGKGAACAWRWWGEEGGERGGEVLSAPMLMQQVTVKDKISPSHEALFFLW